MKACDDPYRGYSYQMKKFLLLLFVLLFCQHLSAQVSINTDGAAPDNSAMLDLKGTARGLLIPRVSTAARDLIPSPATGLLIYNTTTNLFNVFNGSTWYKLEAAFITSTSGTISAGGGMAINASPGTTPDNSAILDVNNPTRGILIPRTTTESITTPATGLIIYNTNFNLLSYYNGTNWINLCAIPTGVTGAPGSQGALGVAINTSNSGPDPSAILDVAAANKGILIPRLTPMQRSMVLPVTGLMVYNTTINSIDFYNGTAWYQLTTNIIPTPTPGTNVLAENQIVWNWNAVLGATGYRWNTANSYATATDVGAATTITETGLTCNTVYTRYVWAYDGCGNSTGVPISQSTSACPSTCGTSITITHVAGAVAPVNKTVTYGIVTNIPGELTKCWITSNLGSNHQATSVNDSTEASAGWYWQFNRKQGYKHNGSTVTPAWTISSISEASNWLPASDPCKLELGTLWRLPTMEEWYFVDATGGWTTWTGPWSSALKLHAAGYLDYNLGSLDSRGSWGWYWSNTHASNPTGWGLNFYNSWCGTNGAYKSYGFSVRCIRD